MPRFTESATGRHSNALTSLVNEALEFVDRSGYQSCDLGERWNNRLVLERSSLAELYINSRIEVVLHGEWRVGGDKVDWFCRVAADPAIAYNTIADACVESIDANNRDGGQDQVVFVVVVEGVEGPERFVRSIGRPYLVEKKVHRSGEGCLYRVEVRNGLPGMGYKVLPFRPHREVGLASPLVRPADTSGQVVECSTEVMEGVADNERGKLCDWLKWSISQCEAGWIRVGRLNVSLDSDAVPIFAQGLVWPIISSMWR